MSIADKLLQMCLALAILVIMVAILLFVAQTLRGKRTQAIQGWLFILPTIVAITIGIIYPMITTIIQSFRGLDGKQPLTLSNYTQIFTTPDYLHVIVNTALWVLVVPVASIIVGLIYAIIVDRTRFEAVAKALIFLPMAISMVGASIIWKFMYEARPIQAEQIGLLNQIRKLVGLDSISFISVQPWNTFFLIVVMIWIQAGFAMTVLSAAIKAIPDEIVEAAKIDGARSWKLFFFITLPSIRSALIMVLTTIAIAALKVFDIVRTMTNGNFNTSVVANEFYVKSFRQSQPGLGSALAMLLFIMVIPIIIYNVRQLKKA